MLKEEIETKEKKKKKPKKSRKVLKAIMLIILIAIIGFACWFGYRVHKNGGGVSGILGAALGHDEETKKQLDKIYCVLIGQSQNLTDTIMLASYDPKTQEASLLSIPRDTFVGKNKKSATAWDKINALYQKSPDKTISAIRSITGIDVNYYLTVDTKALRELVDKIGGVYFDVPIDMNYSDPGQDLYINLKAGYQLLDGDKAEQVVRFRHNQDGSTYPSSYGEQDIGRMRTQREFITAVIKQTMKVENIFKINQFVDIAKENVKTNLDFNIVKDYIPYAVEFNVENLKTGTLPGTPELCNGVWIYSVDEEETEKMINELFGEQGEDLETEQETNTINNNMQTKETSKNSTSNSKIKIELLNGSGSKSKLSELTKKLEEEGYIVDKTGNTSTTSKTTIINRTNQSSDKTDEIKQIVGKGIVSNGESHSNIDITIIIGKDY